VSVLPEFLGIGAERSGTSWLDTLLRNHPRLYLPQQRKEVRYFDLYFDRGVEWYQGFFSGVGEGQTAGEFSPTYLYSREAPGRIRSLLPDCRFLAILRHPVDRSFSHYQYWRRNRDYRGSFEDFLRDHPDVIERGFYAGQFRRYLDLFPPERFLVFVFEQAVQSPAETLERLASFLGIPASGFRADLATQRVNDSEPVRFTGLLAGARTLSGVLRRYDLDRVVNAAKRAGLVKLFGRGEKGPGLAKDLRASLGERYREEVRALEEMLPLDLSRWEI